MKNILLLSFVAFSCAKDENNEPKANFPEHLIGKWKMTSCIIEDDASLQSNCSIQVTKNIYDIWFKKDGTYLNKAHFSDGNNHDKDLICDDNCFFSIREVQIDTQKTVFLIIIQPDAEGKGFLIPAESLSKNELILSFAGGYNEYQALTYTRVE